MTESLIEYPGVGSGDGKRSETLRDVGDDGIRPDTVGIDNATGASSMEVDDTASLIVPTSVPSVAVL
jgi:hypothetical protein